MLDYVDILALALGILLIVMGYLRLTYVAMPMGLGGRLDDLLDERGRRHLAVGYLVIGPLLSIATLLYWLGVLTQNVLVVCVGVAILLTAAVTFVGVFGSARRNTVN